MAKKKKKATKKSKAPTRKTKSKKRKAPAVKAKVIDATKSPKGSNIQTNTDFSEELPGESWPGEFPIERVENEIEEETDF